MAWSNVGVAVLEAVTVIITTGTPGSGIFVYAGTPGPGALIGSWAAAPGLDAYGNSYPAGLEVGNGSGEAVGMELAGTTPTLYWDAGTANTTNFFAAFAETLNAGTNQYGQLVIAGQQDATQLDFAAITLNASSQSGVQPAQLLLTYTDPAGTEHVYAFASFNGFTIPAGSVTGVHPGTGGTRANPAVAESWQTATLASGFTSNAQDEAPRYRMEGLAAGIIRLDGTAYTTAATAAGATIFTLPVGYRPVIRRRFSTVCNAAGLGAVGSATVTVATTGAVTMSPSSSASGQQVVLDGCTFPVD